MTPADQGSDGGGRGERPRPLPHCDARIIDILGRLIPGWDDTGVDVRAFSQWSAAHMQARGRRRRAAAVAEETGGIDIALNAVAFPFVHGRPAADLAVEDIVPPDRGLPAVQPDHAKAVARHMTARRSGTILTLSSAASQLVFTGNLTYGTLTAGAGTLVGVLH